MKYFVVENFTNHEDCKNLINDAKKLINKSNYYRYHGNREDIASSSLAFNQLLLESPNWKNLSKKLNSKEFFETCCNKLGIDSDKFYIKDFFKLNSPTLNQKRYKMMSNLKVNLISNKSLLKLLIYRSYRDLLRRIKFSKIFNISKKPIELLYNYAQAGNGYSREIHRDSDSRLIIFILYLNDLSENGEGGTLDFYKLIKEDKNLVTPSYDSCEKVDSIKPEVGKLVMLLNEDDSYHAVSEIKNFTNYRHFIYGAFTLLSNKNQFIKNKSKVCTDYHNYE